MIVLISVVIFFLMGISGLRWFLLWRNNFNDRDTSNISSTYVKKIKIKNREEMFQFVINNQEELDQVIDEMVSNYGTSDERITILYKHDSELKSLEKVYELFEEVSAMRIAIDNMEEVKQVDILFDYAPSGSDYWGIYYSKTGDPADWWDGSELLEQDGIYVQSGSFYKYETEKIVANWYYFQCDTR